MSPGDFTRGVPRSVAVACVWLACTTAAAAPQPPPRRAILVLVSGMTARQLLPALASADSRWSRLRDQAAVAAMNCAVPGPDNEEGSRLAIRSGRRVAPPARPRGGAAPPPLRSLGQVLAEAGRLGAFEQIDLPPQPPEAFLVGAERMLDRLNPQTDLLILASPNPGQPRGGQWQELAPVILWGGGNSGAGRSGLLTSGTTRTPGLLANSDLAPTILSHLGAPIPTEMEGHAARRTAGSASQAVRLAFHAHATRAAMVPGLVGWGAFAFLAIAAALIALHGRRFGTRAPRLGIALAATFPAAFLWVAPAAPSSAAGLLLMITAAALGLVLLASLLPGRSPLIAAFGILSISAGVGLATGGVMTGRNLMSDFPNIGARFYGIGNEYEGLLLGVMALLPAALGGGPHRFWPVALWTLLLIGSPSLGADYGGALAIALTGATWLALDPGRRLPWLPLIAGGVGTILLGALLVWLDYSQGPGHRTHAGELLARVLVHGPAPAVEMVGRKLAENLAMALTPYFVGGILGALPVLVWFRRTQWEPLRDVLARLPEERRGLLTALIGGGWMLLLNDTGVIAWAMATGTALVRALDLLLEARPGAVSRTPNSPASTEVS